MLTLVQEKNFWTKDPHMLSPSTKTQGMAGKLGIRWNDDIRGAETRSSGHCYLSSDHTLPCITSNMLLSSLYPKHLQIPENKAMLSSRKSTYTPSSCLVWELMNLLPASFSKLRAMVSQLKIRSESWLCYLLTV